MPDSNSKDKTTQKEAGQSAAASKNSTIKTARKTTSGTVQKAEKAQVKEEPVVKKEEKSGTVVSEISAVIRRRKSGNVRFSGR